MRITCAVRTSATGRALLFDSSDRVTCHNDRTYSHTARIFDERVGHLNIELLAALARRACQRRVPLQFIPSAVDGCLEASPVRYAQVLGNDQIQAAAQCFCHAVAEQLTGSGIPAHNPGGAISIDQGVGDLLDDPVCQSGPSLMMFSPKIALSQGAGIKPTLWFLPERRPSGPWYPCKVTTQGGAMW